MKDNMAIIVPAALVLGVLVALGVIVYSNTSTSAATEALRARLKDPTSVLFRNVRWVDGYTICGEYNAKNGFGAYTGYDKFSYSTITEIVAGDDEVLFDDDCL